jgi:activator of HSP90 ATPase
MNLKNIFFRIEKDCTNWAHDRIKGLLACLSCEDISISKVNSIEGDVSVNQRKGRVKQLFDLEITFEYKNSRDGSTGTGFISDFTADYDDVSDLNLKMTPKIEQVGNFLKAVGEVVKAFKNELHEIHGKPLLLEASQASENSESIDTNSNSCLNNVNVTEATVSKSSQQSSQSFTSATATIVDEINFPCPPDQLYLMLTDPARIRSWTRSPASIPQVLLPGALFTLFDGNITCKFLTLSQQRIEMEWKLKSWASNSNVVIEIEADKQGSVLKINQTDVPSGEADITKNNWHNYYWNPIKRAFGVL